MVTHPEFASGSAELRAIRREGTGILATAFLFSFAVNILMLTGPLYMLQVYDRVLGSRSEETLLALSLLAAGLYGAMGVLDHARGRLMALAGARFQDRLDRRVLMAAQKSAALAPDEQNGLSAQHDVEAIRRVLSSPVMLALFDLPWTPLFMAAIFVFHPWLGWLAVAGGIMLICITLLNQSLTRGPHHAAGLAGHHADRIAEQLRNDAGTLLALGMQGAGLDRWQTARRAALMHAMVGAGRTGLFGAIAKAVRLFLQSAMLGLGALVVLRGEMTTGAMIAASVLLGRALAPIEVAVGQWAVVQRAKEGWTRLSRLLTRMPAEGARTALPRPRALLEVTNLSLVPPGDRAAVLRAVHFRVEPGQALGVIGPSGAGKSALARAVAGIWRPSAGAVRLDGATLDQFDPEALGAFVGYLPQRVLLFDGTIAENIARLQSNPKAEMVIAAARMAAAHEMILGMPDGYDTHVTMHGGRLTGGQIQRIGLARALYGDPVIVVLDEPNAHLDNAGSVALNLAIRAMKANGKAVLIMAHRPAAIQDCNLLLVLEDGTLKAFGPRDQVLRSMVRNHTDITGGTSVMGMR